MNSEELKQYLQTAISASIDAGNEILDVYDSDFAVEHKEDKSPLTLADKQAHEKISEYLLKTSIPILSEEGKEIPYEERKNWHSFWMVDPLDGTKEFVKRNGEFTVNIALIQNGNPILGVIYVPVKRVLYFAAEGIGAYKNSEFRIQNSEFDDLIVQSHKLPNHNHRTQYTVVASRSHPSQETEDFINDLKNEHGEVGITSMGSSLKICLVAEGSADIYPRFGPTMEWDTAAGQAIVQCAGKQFLHYQSGKPMIYNKENLLNDWFIVK
ncbi:MAG: 3'(2'),5'-bisphosphate nucleotidase [Flavobacteriales bacterium]|nr:MAG: 3'(2'),5'-bisphosphate nucleotidase [Flavobacteriales bacterium]